MDEAKSLGHLSCLGNIHSTNFPEETERLTDDLLNTEFRERLDYAALAKAREEARQLQIYKANAEMLLRTDADEQRQTREHQQEK